MGKTAGSPGGEGSNAVVAIFLADFFTGGGFFAAIRARRERQRERKERKRRGARK